MLTDPGVIALLRALAAAACDRESDASRLYDQLTGPMHGHLVQRFVSAAQTGQLRSDADLDAAADAIMGVIPIASSRADRYRLKLAPEHSLLWCYAVSQIQVNHDGKRGNSFQTRTAVAVRSPPVDFGFSESPLADSRQENVKCRSIAPRLVKAVVPRGPGRQAAATCD